MIKVTTEEQLIDTFLNRGVENIYPSKEELKKKLMSGERLRIYQGFDPTGPYLHVGHAIGIRALSLLQQLGHEVIFLIGDFTAKVGDPDKDSTRKLLTDEEIEKNMTGWKQQAAQLIDFGGDNPVRFERNHKWLSKLKLDDLIRLMSKITVQQMLDRDMFDRRIKEGNPIGLHEFIYPLMQGFDGVAMEVDMEIAGADQTFNMLVGRDLNKAYLGKEKFIRTNKMMDAPDGRTMSKTKGNGINLGDTAEVMYGKAMSYPDTAILSGLELLTNVPMENVEQIAKKIATGENPMEYKKLMALEIVRAIKGDKEAEVAQEYFEKTVQNKELPAEIEEVYLPIASYKIVDLLVELKMVTSKSEARRLIEQGGIKMAVDGAELEVIKDVNCDVLVTKKGLLLQRGKRQFVRIRAQE
jgi:tyrosyl-tRNA synthetase